MTTLIGKSIRKEGYVPSDLSRIWSEGEVLAREADDFMVGLDELSQWLIDNPEHPERQHYAEAFTADCDYFYDDLLERFYAKCKAFGMASRQVDDETLLAIHPLAVHRELALHSLRQQMPVQLISASAAARTNEPPFS